MKKNNRVLIIALAMCLAGSEAFSLPLFSGSKKDATQPLKPAPDTSSAFEKTDSNNLVGAAVLQGLNKVTGKTSELRIKIGEEINFGKLTIKAKKCWRSSPDQRPENKVLLEIEEVGAADKAANKEVLDQTIAEKTETQKVVDKTNDNSKKIIFYGWMFSSSPSISGLEHPIYDITVIECKN